MQNDRNQIKNGYIFTLLVCYTLILVWIIVFKCNINEELFIERNRSLSLWERFTFNIIPFRDVIVSIKGHRIITSLAFFLNTVLLIPGGMLLGFFVGKKSGLLVSLAFILGIEIFQLFSCWGGFDFTDVIMNVLGVYIGFLIYDLLYPVLSAKLINKLALITLFPAITVTLFAITLTIIHFPV